MENKEVKGQKYKEGKIDPQVEVKGAKGKKIDYTIEEATEDMKLTLGEHYRVLRTRHF